MRFTRLFAMAALLLAGGSAVAEAQFGRNKVQYEHFDFQVLKTEHFDIYYYTKESDAAVTVGRMAERWYTRLSTFFNHPLSGRQPVVLYASHPAFQQTNVVEGELGEGTGGVTEGLKRRVTLPMAASLGDTDHVLGHELVHAFQYDILGRNVEGLPLWFIEGMAEYLSLGARDVQTAMWLRDAAIEDRLPKITDLDNPRYFPYRFGHAFWAYIGGRWGDRTIASALQGLAPGLDDSAMAGRADAITVIEALTGQKRDDLSAEWHAAIRETYGVGPAPTHNAKETRPAVISDRTGSGSMNVGPALSPDGTKLAFLSARSRLSIDLFLADATTGKVLRKLIDTATDPHFESLQFLASAGAWDPESQRLAIATIRGGKPALAIVNTVKDDAIQEVPLPDLDEVFQPTWSPDGTLIAFSAQVGGFTDLFVCDVATGQTRRLTEDAFADLEPAWSPDGQRIAFVTDQFTANLPTLEFRRQGLATFSVDDQSIVPVETGLDGNAINPQWATDGALFFISDAGGRQNVYRLAAGSRTATKVTDETTGVAGITPLSPALSLARGAGRAAVSVFRDSGYEIHVIDPSQPAASAAAPGAVRDAALLPPASRPNSVVTDQLRSAAGLPAATAFQTQAYSSHLSLVGVGQQVGVSTGGVFGTYVSGGVGMQFSDTLGNHLLDLGVSVNGGVKDVAATATYLNRTSRWNWGFFGERVPLLTGSVAEGLIPVNGQTAFVQRTDLFRDTYLQAGALTAYPFNRSMRLEFSGAVRRISFNHEVVDDVFDPISGVFLGENRSTVPSETALKLFDVGTAFVRDTSANGATSPVRGDRLRLEVGRTSGDLSMTNVMVDLREYAMPVRPVTLAARVLHVGRYGAGGEDLRLTPLFLGYSTLVRGYDPNSFDASECTPTSNGGCPEFDRLLGSRILVFNGEVRAPALGLFRHRLDYGPLPVELFGFFDSGVAWTRADKPAFAGGPRPWVASAGAGLRVNLFGFAIGEFNLVRPISRPRQGWMFQFNLRPGF